MVRSTAKNLAGKTAAAARKVTSVARKAGTSAAQPVAERAAPKSTSTKRATTKQGSAKTEAPATKAPATKKKTATKEAPVTKKAPTKTKKAAPASKKAPATKAPTTKKAATQQPVKKKPAAKEAPATRAATATKGPAAKRAPASKKAPAKKAATAKAATSSLAVKSGEQPWSDSEVAEVRAELSSEVKRLSEELDLAEHELNDLMRDAGEGAGNDQADVGSATFERDHEVSLANNARDMLVQTRHALERIDDGTYGLCESCGHPIGKMRLQAFPRATLCMTCKQREERR
jgi:RNA polymerase-binding protein DksA